MRVILKQDVKKVGKKGEVVEVSDGYGRNFLVARGLAVMETKISREILSEQKEEAKKEYELNKTKAEETAKELDQLVLTFHVKSGESGRMFGSVSTKQIMTELRRLGYHFDKHVILDTHPIQSLGTTKVRLEIFKGVIGTISVKVLGTN